MDRHQELTAGFIMELQRSGWSPRKNKGIQKVDPEGGYYIADGLFDKDGEVLALEVGCLKRDKCEGLRPLIESGKLSLLHVSYSGDIQFFDRSYFPKSWPYSSFTL